MTKKVVLIGASTPNLYAARLLIEKGIKAEIFEKRPEIGNDSRRLLPIALLNKFKYEKHENGYVRLSDLKKHLASGLPIAFNSVTNITGSGELFSNNEKINCDSIIMNTGHKKTESKHPHVFTYDYGVKDLKEIYPGNSLERSIEKVEQIVDIISSNL
jgi:hypothetical protein